MLLCAVHCCALLCVAVRHVCSGLDATHTHSSPRRGLPPKSAPCKVSSKHKQQSRFRAATARAGHGHPRRRMASRAARELNLSIAGFCFRSSTSSATGLNPSNFRRAFRMRRVGSHTGRSGKFCERTRTDKCAMHARNGGRCMHGMEGSRKLIHAAAGALRLIIDCRRSFHVACAAAKTAPRRHNMHYGGLTSRLRDVHG